MEDEKPSLGTIKLKYFLTRDQWSAAFQLLPKGARWNPRDEIYLDCSPWDMMIHDDVQADDMLVAIIWDDREERTLSWVDFADNPMQQPWFFQECLPLGEELRKTINIPLISEHMDF